MRLSTHIGARPHAVFTFSFTRYVLKSPAAAPTVSAGALRSYRSKGLLWPQNTLTLKRRW